MTKRFAAIIEREGNGYVATCPEVDVAGRGRTEDEAKENLQEAMKRFIETAPPEEVKKRTKGKLDFKNTRGFNH